MKAVLSFELPEEGDAHKDALHGADYRNILEDLCEQLRSRFKYDGDGNFGGICLKDILTHEGAEKLRAAIYTECQAQDLPIT